VPHLNRAIAYEQLGVDAAASGDFSRAQSLWRQAVEDCDVAITSDPKEFAAWFDRGNVQMRQEDWNAALESFSKAADLAPGLAGYRLRAAALLFQTGNTDKAQQQLRGLVRKYGNYAEAHAALAAMQWASGAVESAEEQLARALDADARTWGDIKAVRGVTRWPPMLYDAYSKLLSISN
jgi:tetratricopeptide (TPR) repeat protein